MYQKLAFIYSSSQPGQWGAQSELQWSGSCKELPSVPCPSPPPTGLSQNYNLVKLALHANEISANEISRFIKFHKGNKNLNIRIYLEDILVRGTLCIPHVLLDLSILARGECSGCPQHLVHVTCRYKWALATIVLWFQPQIRSQSQSLENVGVSRL